MNDYRSRTINLHLSHVDVSQAVTLEDAYYEKLLSIITSLDIEGYESILPGVNQEVDEGEKCPPRTNVTHENLRGLLRLPVKDIYQVLTDLTDKHMAQRMNVAAKLNARHMEYAPYVDMETFEAELSGDHKPAMNIGSSVSVPELARLDTFDRER